MVWTYIQNNLLDLLFTIVTFILGCLYRDVRKRLMEEKTKSDAIAEGVQSLLRENIVANFNKYHQDRKHCPIYAKESLKRVYDAYHNLGGNDVATALYEKDRRQQRKRGQTKMMSKKSKKWLKAAGIRAVKTVAQTAVALLPAAATLSQVDWMTVAGTAALAGVASILTSVAGLPEIKED